MKRLTLLSITLFISNLLLAQSIEGHYSGALSRDGSVQLIQFDLHNDGQKISGTYTIPEAGLYEVPVEYVQMRNDTLNAKFYYGSFYWFPNSSGTEITGVSEGWNPKLRLHVKRTQKSAKAYSTEPIEFGNNGVSLKGCIYHPKQFAGKKPVYVILVHGSGSQDRYSPYYISLGHRLANAGYGVLLYDKRGSGSSGGDHLSASMQDLAGDAVAAFDLLSSHPNLQDAKLGYLGTSQGGWVAPLAANSREQTGFLILNVGPAVSIFEQDIDRVSYGMKNDGWSQAEINRAIAYTELYFEYARNPSELKWAELSGLAAKLKTEPWADMINIPADKEDFKWWQLNDFSPKESLSTLSCPTLSLFGEFDQLVPPDQNLALMKKYLEQAGVRHRIIVVSGVIHDMKTFQGLNGDNWDWPKVYWEWRKEPVQFFDSILTFLDRL